MPDNLLRTRHIIARRVLRSHVGQRIVAASQLGYVVQTDAVPTDTGNHTPTPQSNSPFEETLLALKQRQQAVQHNAKQLDYGNANG